MGGDPLHRIFSQWRWTAKCWYHGLYPTKATHFSYIFPCIKNCHWKLREACKAQGKPALKWMEMDFDNHFWWRVDRLIKVQWGVDVFGNTAYTDLDGLLDNKRFIRCFYSNGDFWCYHEISNFQEKETTCWIHTGVSTRPFGRIIRQLR